MSSDAHWRKHLRPWQPGQSGNPSGKPKGLLSRGQVEQTFQSFHNKTRQDLKDVINDKKSTILEIMVASVMEKAIEDGDASRLSFLLDRAVGKLPNVPDMTPEELLRKELAALSDEQLIQLAQERMPLLIEAKKDV